MDHCSASGTSEHDEHRGRQPGIRAPSGFGAPSGPEAPSGPFDHPVYKKLAVINGEINKLTKQQMVEKLAELHLDTRGLKDVLKKRLKSYYKRKNLGTAKVVNNSIKCRYDNLLVIDFEATCDREATNYPHEIIEFPVVLIDTLAGTVVDEFHSYVRPVVNPHLSAFCVELTGIAQEQVDSSPAFPEVLNEVEKWMDGHHLGTQKKFAVVTDGPWDMCRFMYLQCLTSSVGFPKWARKWINIRKAFCNRYRTKKASVLTMLEGFGLAFEGRQHSGLADSRNISRIVIQMLEDGCPLNVNERVDVGHTSPATLKGQTKMAEVFSVPRNMSSSEDETDCDVARRGSEISGSFDGCGDGVVAESENQDGNRSNTKVPYSNGSGHMLDADVDDCSDLLRYAAIQNSEF